MISLPDEYTKIPDRMTTLESTWSRGQVR